ncbi:MAG: hypothetical protein HY290_28750 [Planctomycetia bacterium]|nr:hypothetical protein [Planctomycetia bacterium]
MSRIALVASLAMLTSRGPLPVTDRPPPRRFAEPETFPSAPVVASAAGTGPIVWRPEPSDPSPFGLIPTDWTVQPQLLPLAVEVQTIFAAGARK